MKSFSWRSFSNRVSKNRKKILEIRGRIEGIVGRTRFFDATIRVCGPMFYHSTFVIRVASLWDEREMPKNRARSVN